MFTDLFALLCVGLHLPARAQQPIYIYRNDGSINAFLHNDIDSIKFSNYDSDSVYHAGIVSQVVYAADSVYVFPLAAIDSVSFMPHNHIFTACPDGNHPHMIDLGLPSGTKWACCNLGASTPDEFVGYYAWGETEEKSRYGKSTYLHYNISTGLYYYLFSYDIAGSWYDVVHVKWGGSWRMPSAENIQELLRYCRVKKTSQNGVRGMLVTGSNGGTIFLPAAGRRWDDYKSYNYTACYYWSSSQEPHNSGYAWYLYMNFDNDSTYPQFSAILREMGMPVRAVCP